MVQCINNITIYYKLIYDRCTSHLSVSHSTPSPSVRDKKHLRNLITARHNHILQLWAKYMPCFKQNCTKIAVKLEYMYIRYFFPCWRNVLLVNGMNLGTESVAFPLYMHAKAICICITQHTGSQPWSCCTSCPAPP